MLHFLYIGRVDFSDDFFLCELCFALMAEFIVCCNKVDDFNMPGLSGVSTDGLCLDTEDLPL